MEKLDQDLLKKERNEAFTYEDKCNLDEFKGMLQDAFSFANHHFQESVTFEALEKVFNEYFDKCEITTKIN